MSTFKLLHQLIDETIIQTLKDLEKKNVILAISMGTLRVLNVVHSFMGF